MRSLTFPLTTVKASTLDVLSPKGSSPKEHCTSLSTASNPSAINFFVSLGFLLKYFVSLGFLLKYFSKKFAEVFWKYEVPLLG